ncbi:MAG TPA: hypothetical protein VI168_10320 [Croceibacterium sp.]
MLEWLVAIVVFALLLGLVPRVLRRTKAVSRKGGGSGVIVGIGLAFAMVFDPKAAQAMEIVDQKQDESEDEESGNRP